MLYASSLKPTRTAVCYFFSLPLKATTKPIYAFVFCVKSKTRGVMLLRPWGAGASDYRPMSVRVHYYSVPYYIRPVTAACFDPPPNVVGGGGSGGGGVHCALHCALRTA
jgi:hypothetical protein